MVERIEINLLPAEYRVHKRTLRLQREVVYPVIVLMLVGVGVFLYSLYMQNMIRQRNNEIDAVSRQIEQNKHIQKEINELRHDKNTIEEKIRALQRITVNREKWVRLMEVLSGRLPDFTWLISVKEESGPPPVLYIEGRTFSFPEVANYMSRLKDNEYILAVDLSNIEQIDNRDKVYRFTISCKINPDVRLGAQPSD